MTRVVIAVEKFHPLTVVYPDLEVIPAGSELFIQLPPVRLDFGPAMSGLIDQHVVGEYPLYGYSLHFEKDELLATVATFIVSGDMPKLLEETWRLAQEQHKEPLAKQAPSSLAAIAMARSLGVE